MDIRKKNKSARAKKTVSYGILWAMLFFGLLSCAKDRTAPAAAPVTVDDPAHNMQVSIGIQPDSIQIGDYVNLVVRVTFPKDKIILFPDFEEEIVPGLEMVKAAQAADTVKTKDKEKRILERHYLITSFDSGRHVLPAFPILVASSSTTMDTVYIQHPLVLKVGTVALAADFKPYGIKDIQSYPSEWWKAALLVLAIVLVLIVVLWFILGREKIKQLLPLGHVVVRTPYEVAVENLQRLKTEKLWERGQTKEYYTQLTDIVRQYIESRTGMPALEKTSEEILRMLPEAGFGQATLEHCLKELFYYADLAKFAKYIPTEADNELSWQRAYEFIDKSKPAIVEENVDEAGKK